jgi:homoserine O-acetyltransferase/O-succinyltransferase
VAFWEGFFLPKDANNLLALLWTWQNADISADPAFGGSFEKALGAIKAKAIVMPASTDLYFPPEDSVLEVEQMPNAKLQVVETAWGHFAGGPGTSPEDIKVLDAALSELLAS